MTAKLTAVLLAGAEELADLAVTADELGAAGVAEVERWQVLDRLSQHLAGLAAFLAALADIVPESTLDVSGALGQLKTAALADRIAGRPCEPEAERGVLELFGA